MLPPRGFPILLALFALVPLVGCGRRSGGPSPGASGSASTTGFASAPAPAATDETPVPSSDAGGAARAPNWPCKSDFAMLGSAPTSTKTYVYGGPASCTLPIERDLVGCPTTITTKGETSTYDIEEHLSYGADGRLARTVMTTATSVKAASVHYRPTERRPLRIVDDRTGKDTVRYDYAGGVSVELLNGPEVFQRIAITVGSDGRTTSWSSESPAIGALASAHHVWKDGRLVRIDFDYPGGRRARQLYSYACSAER